MKLIFSIALFSVISLCPTSAQIKQSHPEYCGIPGGINPPLPNVSASTADPNNHPLLHFSQGIAVQLPALVSEVSQICPLSDGRMVVFGEIPRYEGVAENIFIVDSTQNSIVDSFWASHPVLSPNQRWIAFAKFAPFYVSSSSEILLYDLSKTPVQNRPPSDSVHPNDANIDVGTLIFPPGHENFDGSNIVESQNDNKIVHTLGNLHWAPDSREILFQDMVPNDPGIAIVTLNDVGLTSVLRRPITEADVCGREVAPGVGPKNWKLERAEFGVDVTISVDVGSSGDCKSHLLQLRREEFQPAVAEAHVKPKLTPAQDLGNSPTRKRKKAVRNQ